MFEMKRLLATLATSAAATALLSACAGAPQPSPTNAMDGRAVVTSTANAAPAPKSAPSPGGDLDDAAPAAQSQGRPAVIREGEEAAAPSKEPPGAKKDKGRGDDAPLQPGLGTEWGETRVSRISRSPFVRADPASPFATASVFYNDEAGARALAGGVALQPTPGGTFSVGGGTATVGLKDQSGRFFSGFIAGGRQVVVGSAGRTYTIVIKNNTANRFECVLSVDGLDVLDGKTAAFGKRGYILDAHGEIEVDGFRQSMDTVAAFRFGSVQSSYASKAHGETRNVGVIGVALFNEQVGWDQGAVQQRRDANPFPGN